MAIFNEILVGRYNKAMQRAFGIKATAPLRQLGGEVMPITTIFRGMEERYLESWNVWGIAAVVAAGVAVTTVRLRNPTLSNTLAVIEKISISIPAGQPNSSVNVGLLAVTTDLAISLTGVQRETRIIAANGAVLIASGANATAPPGPIAFWSNGIVSTNLTTDVIQTENQEVSITPGFSLEVQGATAGAPLNVSIFWRERYLEESERL